VVLVVEGLEPVTSELVATVQAVILNRERTRKETRKIILTHTFAQFVINMDEILCFF